MVEHPDPEQLARLAERVARAAGQLLLEGVGRRLHPEAKSSPTDVVTEMDRAAERLLVDALLAERPADAVLGEEGGQRPGTSGVRWVLDPLDGTVNYLYGIPQWAVCVAAELDGRVVAAAVFHPSRPAMYTAVRGAGAFADGRRLTGPASPTLAAALVATGFGYRRERRVAQAAALATVLPAVRDIRRLGAAALDLCACATGEVDAFYEQGLQPWDLAAAGLVAEEAGCMVAGLAGRPPGEDLVIAAAPGLFPALDELLSRAGVGWQPAAPAG